MCCSRFMEDHSKAALIWNYKTREELREALENEIRSFTIDKVSKLLYGHSIIVFIRKSVVMLILVGIMLSLRCAMRAYKKRSKLVTTI